MQVMQQSSNTMSFGRQPPQQFSRGMQQQQQQATVSRSMASSQNMRTSNSQYMASPPVGQQYFNVIEVQLILSRNHCSLCVLVAREKSVHACSMSLGAVSGGICGLH